MARIAARGESVRGSLRNAVQLGHGQVGFPRQPLHHGIQPRHLLPGYRLRAARHQRDLVREEIGKAVHQYGKDKRYGHSVGAPIAAANQDKKHRKHDQEKPGSKDLHVRSSNFPRGPSPRKFSVEADSARVKVAASTRAGESRKITSGARQKLRPSLPPALSPELPRARSAFAPTG